MGQPEWMMDFGEDDKGGWGLVGWGGGAGEGEGEGGYRWMTMMTGRYSVQLLVNGELRGTTGMDNGRWERGWGP